MGFKIFALIFLLPMLTKSFEDDKAKIRTENEKLTCFMMSDNCKLNIISREYLLVDDFKIENNFTHLYLIKSIEFSNGSKSQLFNNSNESTFYTYSIWIDPLLIGRANVTVNIDKYNHTSKIELVIQHPSRVIDTVFNVYGFIFMVLMSLIMGILLDPKVLMKIIKVPYAVTIGIVCQYGCMPLLAFLVSYVSKKNAIESLAIFLYGCSPGGSNSNYWTIMFNGDVDLSVIMTFASTIASLAMMPLWVYTLGDVLANEANIHIPFYGLIGNLFITIVPCIVGLLLNVFIPKMKPKVVKIAKPLAIMNIISIVAFMLYVKAYIFKIIRIKDWLTLGLIPGTGFVLSSLIAFVCCLPKKQIITVSIETSIQNFFIPSLIIFTNFPSPESDYAMVPLLGISLYTAVPLSLILISKETFKYLKKKFKHDKTNPPTSSPNGDVEIKIHFESESVPLNSNQVKN